uniref:SH3 domain containing GRB2 like 2, endophilin A1 n=3 Tax=Canis lupus familiaris TaxID=9615 RepID=A0A8P0N4Q5_CANLF
MFSVTNPVGARHRRSADFIPRHGTQRGRALRGRPAPGRAAAATCNPGGSPGPCLRPGGRAAASGERRVGGRRGRSAQPRARERPRAPPPPPARPAARGGGGARAPREPRRWRGLRRHLRGRPAPRAGGASRVPFKRPHHPPLTSGCFSARARVPRRSAPPRPQPWRRHDERPPGERAAPLGPPLPLPLPPPPPLRRRLSPAPAAASAASRARESSRTMSVAGLKKQFHKATQKVSEKVGGAEGTKLDDDFKEMERKVDVTSRAVMEIMTKTIEYLQPNPASRAKLSMINTMSKIRGQEKGPGYPQAEALLAEAMLKFGRELGDDCNFGPALGEVGEAMRELSEVKDSLDMEVKQNFIDPLQNLHDKDLREIQHHLKKLEGRRLDFDYKKKRQGKIPDEELRQALEKFDESKEIAESSMFNLLEMDIEQVSQLSALVQAQLEYHKQAVQILQQVTVRLEERIRQASSQPRREYQPKPRMSLEFTTGDSTQPNGGLSHTGTPKPAGAPMDQPCCRALYDFEPENEGELGFKEGDIITLTNQIDENWTLM